MKFIDVIRMALGNLRRNRMRTVLTVSGVVVGIGAIVFLVSLGFGLQELMVKKVANLDALTVITVRPGTKEETRITNKIIERFQSFGEVATISPILSYPAQIRDGDGITETIINGVIPENFALEDIAINHGQGLSGPKKNEVVVSVGSLKNLNLTNPDDVLGKTFDFNVIQLDESGNIKKGNDDNVLNLKVVGMTNDENAKYAYVPLEVLRKINGDDYASVKIKVSQRKQVASVRKAVESMGFPTTSVKDTVDQIDRAFIIIRSILGGFGFIALMVAAIGIFNTMTISLLERTHEIGIMKAIGGRNGDVAKVFIAEAAFIGLMGGILGVLSGWVLGLAINAFLNFLAVSVGGQANTLFQVPLGFVGWVIGFSFVVSTAAGILPARRASKLNPLEALRYE